MIRAHDIVFLSESQIFKTAQQSKEKNCLLYTSGTKRDPKLRCKELLKELSDRLRGEVIVYAAETQDIKTSGDNLLEKYPGQLNRSRKTPLASNESGFLLIITKRLDSTMNGSPQKVRRGSKVSRQTQVEQDPSSLQEKLACQKKSESLKDKKGKASQQRKICKSKDDQPQLAYVRYLKEQKPLSPKKKPTTCNKKRSVELDGVVEDSLFHKLSSLSCNDYSSDDEEEKEEHVNSVETKNDHHGLNDQFGEEDIEADDTLLPQSSHHSFEAEEPSADAQVSMEEIIRVNTPRILELVTDPLKLATELWAASFINDELKNDIASERSSNSRKGMKLLDEVYVFFKGCHEQKKIQKFCEILKKSCNPGIEQVIQSILY